MTTERRARLLKLAKKRGDKLAIATLTADRTYSPEPDYQILTARLTPRFAHLRRVA